MMTTERDTPETNDEAGGRLERLVSVHCPQYVPDLTNDGMRRECVVEVETIPGLFECYTAVWNEFTNKWNPANNLPAEELSMNVVRRWVYIDDLFAR